MAGSGSTPGALFFGCCLVFELGFGPPMEVGAARPQGEMKHRGRASDGEGQGEGERQMKRGGGGGGL